MKTIVYFTGKGKANGPKKAKIVVTYLQKRLSSKHACCLADELPINRFVASPVLLSRVEIRARKYNSCKVWIGVVWLCLSNLFQKLYKSFIMTFAVFWQDLISKQKARCLSIACVQPPSPLTLTLTPAPKGSKLSIQVPVYGTAKMCFHNNNNPPCLCEAPTEEGREQSLEGSTSILVLENV